MQRNGRKRKSGSSFLPIEPDSALKSGASIRRKYEGRVEEKGKAQNPTL